MNIYPIVEHNVRLKLGQKLTSQTDRQADHLRFDMTGQRDGGDAGGNIYILSLFKDIPLTVTGTYAAEEYSPFDYKFYLSFDKGEGTLYQKRDGVKYPVKSFAGWGTVTILVHLIFYFNLQNNYIQ